MLDERGIVVRCGSCGQQNRLPYRQLDRAVRCARCKTDLQPPSHPIDIASTQDFDRLVSQATIPIVVDYWAPWCGPCRVVAPELAKVAARNAGRFVVVKVNTDVLTDLGDRYAIRSIPTLAVFSGGREAGRSSGARPAAEIERFIEGVAKTAAPTGPASRPERD
jgi:thioredoxin 2